MRYTTRIIVPPRVKRSSLPGGYGSKPKAQALGVRKTFGFGDRLGAATDVHVAMAATHPDFAPIFAQQTGAELAATGRKIPEILATVVRGVDRNHFKAPWGADAEQLRTPQELEQAVDAGFTYLTIDPGEWIASTVDDLSPEEVIRVLDGIIADGDLPPDWMEAYLNRTIELPGNQRLQLTLEPLQRAAAKYGRAIQHCARMAETAARASHGRPYELEILLGRGLARATTPLEHLFAGLELEARGVRMVSAGLNLGAGYEPGANFTGNLEAFETTLQQHVAVAEFCGPHKLSFHEASDKSILYPALTRVCGEALHLKTSGLSYLEALRVVLRVEPLLFEEITRFARGKFETDRVGAGVSSTLAEVEQLPAFDPADAERFYLDGRVGRQMLHVTFGSIMAGRDEQGRPFRDALLALLDRYADIYREVLSRRLEEMFRLLGAG